MTSPESAAWMVSVIIPVKNSGRYLAQALDSVMAQTYPHFEIIIVDDHSTDDTPTIAAAYPRTRFIQQTGTGLAAAWNSGIAAVRANLICFLDSDDYWTPDKLALQIDQLRRCPELECAIGHVQFFAEAEDDLPASFNPVLLKQSHVAYMPGTLIARRSLFDRIGTFSNEWQIAPDIDWFAKVKDEQVPLGILPNVLLFKRVHANNLTYTAARTPLMNDEMLRLLHHSILRQRAHHTSAGKIERDG